MTAAYDIAKFRIKDKWVAPPIADSEKLRELLYEWLDRISLHPFAFVPSAPSWQEPFKPRLIFRTPLVALMANSNLNETIRFLKQKFQVQEFMWCDRQVVVR